MFADTEAYNGFAVDDIEKAREFYGETLGLNTSILDDQNGLLQIDLAGGRATLVYLKSDFTPATYTILNFTVDDVEGAVDQLSERGVEFERYEDFDQDEKGIFHDEGFDIAWFKDPAGNILAVHKKM
jgi:catechol 2,3-dioxygenase-like lactoylglutathione lyase family enzyme